jgi:putative transposase
MSKPVRNSNPASVQERTRTFFVTSSTSQGRNVLQSTRMAELFIDVLRSYSLQGRFRVHEFVVMPNHVHLLITINDSMAIEKAIQLIKGNFSYRAKKELGVQHAIWQRGFSENRIYEQESFVEFRSYIKNNPVKAGLAKTAEDYPFCSAYLRKQKAAGAKA